jgi:hypothetical protein
VASVVVPDRECQLSLLALLRFLVLVEGLVCIHNSLNSYVRRPWLHVGWQGTRDDWLQLSYRAPQKRDRRDTNARITKLFSTACFQPSQCHARTTA